jgi:hypothetical protein
MMSLGSVPLRCHLGRRDRPAFRPAPAPSKPPIRSPSSTLDHAIACTGLLSLGPRPPNPHSARRTRPPNRPRLPWRLSNAGPAARGITVRDGPASETRHKRHVRWTSVSGHWLGGASGWGEQAHRGRSPDWSDTNRPRLDVMCQIRKKSEMWPTTSAFSSTGHTPCSDVGTTIVVSTRASRHRISAELAFGTLSTGMGSQHLARPFDEGLKAS